VIRGAFGPGGGDGRERTGPETILECRCSNVPTFVLRHSSVVALRGPFWIGFIYRFILPSRTVRFGRHSCVGCSDIFISKGRERTWTHPPA
jgi:hypothetical protein